MTDNDEILRHAEGLAGYRRLMLVVNALSYMVWVSSFALLKADLNVPPYVLTMAGLIAFPVWLISLIALLWGIRHLARQKQLRALIDDERTQVFTRRAFQAGYWALLVALCGLYAAGHFIAIDVTVVVPFLVALGVALPPLTYALLYRS